MRKHVHNVGSATIAIAAMLALGPTPLAAQMAPLELDPGTVSTAPPPATTESPIIGPVEGNTAPATPVIVAEPVLVAPVPVVEQPATSDIDASDAATSPAAAAVSEPAQEAPSRQRAVPAPRAEAAPAPRTETASADIAPPADEPLLADEALAGDDIAPLAVDPVPVAVPAEPVTVAEPADQSEEAILAGILAAFGLGAIGWTAFALRRRKRRAAKLRPMPLMEKREPAEPVSASIPAAAAAPIAPPTPSDIREWMRPNAATARADNAVVSNEGAAVALPAKEPETFAERDALLRRMVEARPDRANPFRSPKARTRRARLIMQSLGHTFAKGRSWIDLSQYPNNWPELRRNYAAAA